MVSWYQEAWDDYLFWQEQDRKTLRRINLLLKDVTRHPFTGIGKPELLKGELNDFWSRRIDAKNRFVYLVRGDNIYVVSCKGHYNDR